MNKPKRECGSCKWYIRMKTQGCPGVCGFHDTGQCKPDYGRKCPDWEGKKYER